MKKIIVIIYLFCLGCAQQGVLTGGEKDTSPPKLLTDQDSLPLPLITNFIEKEFILEFDENIQYLKGKKSLLINPEIVNYEVAVEKNNLLIRWKDTLDINTTYSFIFRNSIADLTEKNKIKNFRHTFSNGNIIDTARIQGSVLILPEKTPAEELLIELKNIENGRVYHGYSNKTGAFDIKNIKKGLYSLTYFEDKNSDFILDTLQDLQGFYSEKIIIHDSTRVNETFVYQTKKKTKIEKTALNKTGVLEIEFNQVVDSCIVFDTINKHKYYSLKNSKKHLFHFKDSSDKFLLIINSKANNFCDTLRIASNNKGKDEITFRKKEQTNLIYNNSFELLFNQYLKNIDHSKMKLTKDSVDALFDFRIKENQLTIEPSLGPGNYILKLFPNSIYGLKHIKLDTSFINFNISPTTELSTLQLNIKNLPHSNSILQIIQNKVVKKEIVFNGNSLDSIIENCISGNYQLRIIADTNKDKYWTTGDITKKRQPEKIYNYEGEVKLKKNWAANISWDFSLSN